MNQINKTEIKIYQSIQFIKKKQKQIQQLRQDLNYQIVFNLKDTYKHISKHQKNIHVRSLATFLQLKSEEQLQSLVKLIKWNNHNSGLNLSFSQFSALLITRQDKLLAKIVVQRQQMGSVPYFILDFIKQIIKRQMQIHEFCMNLQIKDNEQLQYWLQSISIQQKLIIQKINLFIYKFNQYQEDEQQQNLFQKFIQISGNVSIHSFKYLWINYSVKNQLSQCKSKNNLTTLATNKSPPKELYSSNSELLLCKSQYRSQFFDCMNRTIPAIDRQIRHKKSLQKHIKRIDSTYNLRQIQTKQRQVANYKKQFSFILQKLKQILNIQNKLQQLKIQLCLCPDFFPILFFDSIPKQKNNKITPKFLKQYLQTFGINIQLQDIFFLFRRYTEDAYGLDFNNFCRMFDIANQNYYLIQKNRHIHTLNQIDISTKKIYFSLFKIIVKTEKNINKIKLNLFKKSKNIPGTLNYIFTQYQNMISAEDLIDLYQQYTSVQISRLQIKLLWNRLNLKLNQDQVISKQILSKQIIPYFSNILKY